MKQEPYWRDQIQVLRNGRLEWYAEPATEQFWAELWAQRLHNGYYSQAERGDLGDIEGVLLKHLQPGGVHLEAGCGLGYWVAALLARGYRVEGIEYSQSLVNLVRTIKPDLPVRRENALAIDRPSNYYDSYLSFGVVEHRQAGPEPFLVEAYRVLKPGGVMIISVPFLCPLRFAKGHLGLYRDQPPIAEFFQYAFGEQEFGQFLVAAGFHIEEAHYQHVRRCLVEELPLYFRLNRMKGARYWTRAIDLLFPARLAAHLLLFVARKSADIES